MIKLLYYTFNTLLPHEILYSIMSWNFEKIIVTTDCYPLGLSTLPSIPPLYNNGKLDQFTE